MVSTARPVIRPGRNCSQRVVGLRPGTRGDLTMQLSCLRPGQHFAQVLAGAHGRSPDANFTCRHHDGREAEILSRQTHHQQHSPRPEAAEGGIVGCFGSRGHQGYVDAASFSQFPRHVAAGGMDRACGPEGSGQRQLFLRDIDGNHLRSHTRADLHREVS